MAQLQRANTLSELSDGLSYEVISSMKECFQQMDSNGDGELSKSELAQVMKSLGIKHTDTELNTLFTELDTDKSNTISFTEFLSGLRWSSRSSNMIAKFSEKSQVTKFLKNVHPQQLEELKMIFKEVDKDGNGVITEDELYTMMKKMGINSTPDEFANLFQSLDLNGDGKIDLEEFLSGIRWLKKGIGISSKLAQSKKKDVSSTLSEDKRAIKNLQERNDILVNYLRDIVSRGMKIAADNYRNKDYEVTKAVLETLDWDTLQGMELFAGTVTTPKQREHYAKMNRRLKELDKKN